MRIAALLTSVLFMFANLCAQVKVPGEFVEASTGMKLHFPVEMQVRDAESAIKDGHIAVFGSLKNEAKEHALAARCMKPLLLADLPVTRPSDIPQPAIAATLLFFEFINSEECKAGFKYKDDEAVAGGVAQIAVQLPGSVALTKPLYFDYGKEKMHTSIAAFGLRESDKDQAHALISTSAMRYHGHTFGWLLSARYLRTFNEASKSNILLDDGKTYPLIPFNLDERLQPPPNLVK